MIVHLQVHTWDLVEVFYSVDYGIMGPYGNPTHHSPCSDTHLSELDELILIINLSIILNQVLCDFIFLAAFGTSVVKFNNKENVLSMTKVCVSCTKIRRLSSPSSVTSPSQVITAKRFEINQHSRLYDFNITVNKLFLV